MFDGLLPGGRGDVGIQPGDSLSQPIDQDDLAVILALRTLAIGGYLGATQYLIADVSQSGQDFLFELVFGHHGSPVSIRCRAVLMK